METNDFITVLLEEFKKQYIETERKSIQFYEKENVPEMVDLSKDNIRQMEEGSIEFILGTALLIATRKKKEEFKIYE